MARPIQELFLPRKLPQPYGWQLAAFSRGAQAIGGDFFDCIELPGGQLGIVSGQVYEISHTTLAPGEQLISFSDGIPRP